MANVNRSPNRPQPEVVELDLAAINVNNRNPRSLFPEVDDDAGWLALNRGGRGFWGSSTDCRHVPKCYVVNLEAWWSITQTSTSTPTTVSDQLDLNEVFASGPTLVYDDDGVLCGSWSLLASINSNIKIKEYRYVGPQANVN
ncbi:hypothetical protein FNV43_RR17555 [Rhamnella rubrinervis]|uniref:Uncharacterized protein n=1 Tax=Rhamnella rubrinervis TaxID=2594499 RepID=A0A8K0E4E8_9ROSA|nr:hypothetical protein FNV43_RR17555 [Rhamnella rubrinervis]